MFARNPPDGAIFDYRSGLETISDGDEVSGRERGSGAVVG